MHVEVRRQLVGARSLSPFGSQGLSSGDQAWWQEPLPAELAQPNFSIICGDIATQMAELTIQSVL